jgi:hypothetical protein
LHHLALYSNCSCCHFYLSFSWLEYYSSWSNLGLSRLGSQQRYLILRRSVVISFICIIFLFHPVMTLSSLSTFQCIKVDEDLYKMRIHMDFECYSSDHIAWAMITGVPMLIVWVLAVPIVGFVVLFKFRNRLEDENVKKYLLLLYQGLKPKCFYWEFVNTIRKFITVAINVFLSSYDTYYRILAAISKTLNLI